MLFFQWLFSGLLRAKYNPVRLRPRAMRIQIIEQHAQTTNTVPVDVRILPIPTNGDTIPPAAKHTAPSKAEAIPELARWLSMANAVLEVKVIPMQNNRANINASYIQKLHPDIRAIHRRTERTVMPQQPAKVLLSGRWNLTDKAAAMPMASALTAKQTLKAKAENP